MAPVGSATASTSRACPDTGTVSTVTAYGAALGDPAQAAGVLRARAAAAGIGLAPASQVDMAAAVLGAHAWAVVTGRERLSGSMPAPLAAALAACLARAAGHGAGPDDTLAHWRPSAPALTSRLLVAIDPVARWAVTHAGPVAVHLAAQDLAACPDPRISAAAGFLADYAEELTTARG